VIKENARILDAKMPGFQLTERACSEMAYDLRNISKDIPDNHSTLSWSVRFFTIQSTMEEDEMLLPKEGSDNRYHIEGNLCIVKKSALKDLSKLLVIKW
jgi:hypothetical protein